MKVLIIGGGGREHAIAHALKKSPKVDKLYAAPGNAGIAQLAECFPVSASDIDGVLSLCKKLSPDMVVVAPDDPLVLGMVDVLNDAGFRAFGPNRRAAIVEGSKSFSKEFMEKYKIPTAKYRVFTDFEEACRYVEMGTFPTVIKADGLALGKGVTIAQNLDEAKKALSDAMLDCQFGESGKTVVIEEFMTGPEVSVLCFTDSKTIVPMVSAQDHKRAFDNDMGPNTGGMGTFSPSRVYTDELAKECMEKIFLPTIKGLNAEGRPFRGVLYFGLMLTPNGVKVVEYNARFGDPETQVILPRLKTDLYEIFDAIIDGQLSKIAVEWEQNACVCVVLASGGYPAKYETGFEIKGIKDAEKQDGVKVYHAGTKLSQDGKFLTAGGRVLGVTALGENLDNAIKNAYDAVGKISFTNMHYRKDIGIK